MISKYFKNINRHTNITDSETVNVTQKSNPSNQFQLFETSRCYDGGPSPPPDHGVTYNSSN